MAHWQAFHTERSTLLFLVDQELGKPFDFTKLLRTREPVTRSRLTIRGKVGDPQRKRSIHVEGTEFFGVSVLLATATPEVCREQPCVLEFSRNGKKRRYHPDLLVVWGTQRVLIEVKTDNQADRPELIEEFEYIRELLKEHGYEFVVWKKSEICEEPRYENSRLILRYRGIKVSPLARERIRRALSNMSEMSWQKLSDISAVSAQEIGKLIFDGILHVDWWAPLSLKSTISVVPIGRQSWPASAKGGDVPGHLTSATVQQNSQDHENPTRLDIILIDPASQPPLDRPTVKSQINNNREIESCAHIGWSSR